MAQGILPYEELDRVFGATARERLGVDAQDVPAENVEEAHLLADAFRAIRLQVRDGLAVLPRSSGIVAVCRPCCRDRH